MKIARLPKTIRNISRVYEITKVVARHGFGDVVGRLGIEGTWDRATRWVPFRRKVEEEVAERLSTEERIRKIFEELGSTFIKLGQILATRPDLIPMSLIHELRKLQDDVPPFDSSVAKAVVERELGAKVEEVFQSFEEHPLAAASIAQVHRAVLMNGDEVVLKVQRPGLRQRIDNDLDLLHVIAELLEERVPEVRRWQPVAIVEEFDKSIHKEIDFGREAHNIRRFAKNFEGDPGVYAPRVYDDLSTEKVLTMEFIHGVKMNSDEIFHREDLDRELVAKRGIRTTLQQVFVHGFFHADPHPGNVFVMEDNVICLIDFGMMGSLDQERIDDLLSFLVSVLTNNPDRMIRQFIKQGLVDEDVNLRGLKADIGDLMDRYLGMPVGKINVAIYIQQLFEIITRYHIVLPADLLLMGKSLATVDGIARDIYPELDPLAAIRPQILQIYFRRLTDPDFYTRDVRRTVEDGIFMLQKLPRDLRLILGRLRDGELRVKWHPEGDAYEKSVREQARSSNRIAAAVLIVGLVGVASFLLLGTWASPMFYDAEMEALTRSGRALTGLGITGYVIALLLGLGFSWGLLRTGGQ